MVLPQTEQLPFQFHMQRLQPCCIAKTKMLIPHEIYLITINSVLRKSNASFNAMVKHMNSRHHHYTISTVSVSMNRRGSRIYQLFHSWLSTQLRDEPSTLNSNQKSKITTQGQGSMSCFHLRCQPSTL